MTEAAEWQASVGEVWAREWRRTDRAFAGIAAALDEAILAAAPAGGFAALDIGCGAGGTSLALAAGRPDAAITGVDLSEALIGVARRRAAEVEGGCGKIDFVVGDAAVAAVARGPFDLLVSRHGVMFFPDPVAGFADLHAGARAGARLVFSCFRDRGGNPWGGGAAEVVAQAPLSPADDGPGPFAFADPARVADILASAGWRDAAPRAIDTVFRVGAGPDPVVDAVGFFARIGSAAALLRALPPAEQSRARDRLAAYAAGHAVDEAIDFPAAAWIWTATA